MEEKYKTVEFEEPTFSKRRNFKFDITQKEIYNCSDDLMYGYNQILYDKIYSLEGSEQVKFIIYHIEKVTKKYIWLIELEDVLKKRMKTGNDLRDFLIEIKLSEAISFIQEQKKAIHMQMNNNKIKTDLTSSILSFNYIHMHKESDSFYEFAKALRDNGFVCNKTSMKVFKSAFSREQIKVKIKWIAGIEKLAYFIKSLQGKNSKIDNERSKKWVIARTIFCDENNNEFGINISKQHIPSVNSDKEKIEKCINFLK